MPQTNLVQRMTALNDRLQSIPQRFGVPQYRAIAIRKKVIPEGQVVPVISYLLLKPNPQITNVSGRYIGLQIAQNVTLSADDLMVTGISRAYGYDLLTENVDVWLVDAKPDGNGGYTGVPHYCLYVKDSELLTWEATLTRQKDHEEWRVD